MTTEEILTAALALPEAERLELVQRLRGSISEPVEASGLEEQEYEAELDRRSRDSSKSYTLEEVRQYLRGEATE